MGQSRGDDWAARIKSLSPTLGKATLIPIETNGPIDTGGSSQEGFRTWGSFPPPVLLRRVRVSPGP